MAPVSSLSSSLIIAIILCFLLISLAPTTSSVSSRPDEDLEALICLKRHLSNSARALASWNKSVHFCSWPGVNCSKSHASRVTALHLESHGLDGHIPPCIGNLTFLRRIHFPNNGLNGEIPLELGRLHRLVYLNLNSNNLTGAIPNSVSSCYSLEFVDIGSNSLHGEITPDLCNCSNLAQIYLDDNMLHGSIPDGFSMFPKLSVLFAANNKLTGSIPRTLGSSQSLNKVILTNNSLSGDIPPVLANSSSLLVLDLENNDLSGEIPASLFNSSSLKIIYLAENQFFGSIPPFSHISSLQLLYLSSNNLSGNIPSSVGNSSSLIMVLLASNYIQGSIPYSLSRIPNLQVLDLLQNNFSGIVPISLYNISTLTYLGMGNNHLAGELPENIGHTLPNIQTFLALGNKLGGRIPTSLVNAQNLQKLDLRDNAFNGIIPYFGSLLNLTYLNLAMNQLEAGEWAFLQSLASCTNLVHLRLYANNLQGNLPSSVGSLPKSLETLILSANQISGTIPQEIVNLTNLTLLHMEQNLLTGNIPDSVGNLPNLFVLSLSRNKLSGQIPFSIGNLSQLSELYLQENHLTGSIPAALGQCRKLDILNLSHNHFDGNIPKELFSFPIISEGLDLSHNKLSGTIPMEIGGLINLGPLDISNNQLSGDIPHTLGNCIRLESLHMEGNLLDGRIPESFATLRGIVEMDLSRNNLSGQIPEFFASFRYINLLNLSYNNLEGPVPTSGVFTNESQVFLQGNKDLCAISYQLKLPLCHAYSHQRKRTYHMAFIVGLSVLSSVCLLTSLLAIFLKRRKDQNQTGPLYRELEKLSYADLVRVTDNFCLNNLVGSGRYGSVFIGKTDSEAEPIAIKVFKLDQLGAAKSFNNECKALKNTRHRNLVRVITACSTFDKEGKEFKALVLEYMANGNLESWLHPTPYGQAPRKTLNLGSRIIIAADMAAALEYLHNHCMPPMVHCDLKPSNVLLDEVKGAHVGDFGLAKFLHSYASSRIDSSTGLFGPRGSVGYIAPEYAFGSKVYTEGDVYSYGVIILEMITGKRPTDAMFIDGLTIHKFVKIAFPQRIGEILDPIIIQDYEDGGADANSYLDYEIQPMCGILSCVMKLTKLGLSCSAETPKERPQMKEVCSEVTAIKEEFAALWAVGESHG